MTKVHVNHFNFTKMLFTIIKLRWKLFFQDKLKNINYCYTHPTNHTEAYKRIQVDEI